MNLGHNHLLEAVYRDLGRAAFRNDLLVCALILSVTVIVWRFL